MSDTERDRSRAAAEALSGRRNQTVNRLVDQATRSSGEASSSARASDDPPTGADYSSAKATERREGGVRTFGAPIGRMREGQSTDSNQ